MKDDVKFHEFVLNFNSGKLIHISNKKEEVIRLSPQSTNLLQLLIKKYPEMVSKDEIKSLLWPDVQVDFDNSLHFCIRQIRVALKDTVSSPKYIETIPRRGYKWLVEVQTTKKKKKKTYIYWILAIVSIIIISIGFNHYLSNNNQEREATAIEIQANTRIAIMPLQPSDSLNLFYGNMIAYNLLDLLGNTGEFDVIGPTTTQNVSHEKVYDFLENSGADYIINGKFSSIGNESRVLVEIIRGCDKAHIWVTSYDVNSSSNQITNEIFEGFTEKLKENNQAGHNKK